MTKISSLSIKSKIFLPFWKIKGFHTFVNISLYYIFFLLSELDSLEHSTIFQSLRTRAPKRLWRSKFLCVHVKRLKWFFKFRTSLCLLTDTCRLWQGFNSNNQLAISNLVVVRKPDEEDCLNYMFKKRERFWDVLLKGQEPDLVRECHKSHSDGLPCWAISASVTSILGSGAGENVGVGLGIHGKWKSQL